MKITLSQLVIAILLTGLSYANSGKAQAMLQKQVTLAVNNSSLSSVLKQLEQQADVKFVYSNTLVKTDKTVSIEIVQQPLNEVLNKLLAGSGIAYEVVNDRIVLTQAKPAGNGQEVGEQAFPVSGKIVDETGVPLPGVTVRLNNSTQGTTTDANGAFTINVNAETDVLTFSFIGYENQSVTVGTNRSFNVQMKLSQANNLKEVVVIGYGTTSKANLATAVSTVKGSEINERPTTSNVLQGLAGKVSGVNIMTNSGKPGGAPSIKIRGTASIQTSNDPLYVIDGVVGADITTIDPTIIESIDILKDAAAAAIYGARGSNGVVLVTTRRGKQGASDISFNNTLGFSTLARKIDLIDAQGLADLFRRKPAFQNNTPFPTTGRMDELFDGFTPNYNTDWQDESTRMGILNNHSLTFSGGKEGLSIMANITYRNQTGIMLNAYEKQLKGYMNLNWDVKPWLHLDFRLNAGASQNNDVSSDGISVGAGLRQMYEFPSFFPVTYADGGASQKDDFPGLEASENPVTLFNGIKNVFGRTFNIANLGLTFHLTKELDFVATASGQTNAGYTLYYANSGLSQLTDTENTAGIARRTHVETGGWRTEGYFSYKNNFAKHNLELIGGGSWYYDVAQSTSAETRGFFDDFYSYNNLAAGTIIAIPTSGWNERKFNSFYGRAIYNYDGRYLFSASLRTDGSSPFGAKYKYGVFPAFSAGWNVANENFFESAKNSISTLKIRGSYGVVGNAELTPYQALARLINNLQYFGGQPQSGVTLLPAMANENLRWERQRTVDIGVDIGLLNDRIQLTADYYNKVNDDLLYPLPVAASTGYSTIIYNIGAIRNRGFELGINTVNIRTKNFTWSTNANFSLNRNKVTKLPNGAVYNWGTRILEGRPLNEFFGYVREGVFQTDAEAQAYYGSSGKAGDIKYADYDGSGTKTANDRVPLGNGNPKWEANMTNTVSYKGLSFFIDMGGMYGLSLLNNTKHQMENPLLQVNTYSEMVNSWTPEHPNTMLPAIGSNKGVEVADSYFVEDASFLRIRNIGLTYRIQGDWLKKLVLKGITLGVNVENAFLFTKYSGFDPEYSSFDPKLIQGFDNYQYPKYKTISFSLNANF
ncbi:TonB-dependent receptor [Mucilaginibacter limnophilus]|nr:TonB-dependent receptor [Mucilaginibacter limnophilus]